MKTQKAHSIDNAEKKMMAKVDEKGLINTSVEHQVQDYLISILEMDATDLKTHCKDKRILPGGSASLKHKYAFALFCDVLVKKP